MIYPHHLISFPQMNPYINSKEYNTKASSQNQNEAFLSVNHKTIKDDVKKTFKSENKSNMYNLKSDDILLVGLIIKS